MFKVKENKFGLRHQKHVVQPRFNTIKYGKKYFSYIGSHIWNMLPCHFQTAENMFKRLAKDRNVNVNFVIICLREYNEYYFSYYVSNDASQDIMCYICYYSLGTMMIIF